jgi:predicted enzyme related to lactoylglutathione lyase
MLPNK